MLSKPKMQPEKPGKANAYAYQDITISKIVDSILPKLEPYKEVMYCTGDI